MRDWLFRQIHFVRWFCRSSHDISPVVNGMQVFGFSQGTMHRAIVKFREPPEKQPLTVCFHFPGTFLTHRYVLDIAASAEGAMMMMKITVT